MSCGCSVSEDDALAAADALVATGLRDAGLDHVVLDDGWSADRRDRHGRLRPDDRRFPRGVAALADDLHARGLRLGIYVSATERTCAQRSGARAGATGSGGFEETDAATFAAWGVDLVKADWCSPRGDLADQRAAFTRMRGALRAADESIVLCINPNSHHPGRTGFHHDWDQFADWWRTTPNAAPIWQRATGEPAPEVGVLDVLETHRERVVRSLARGVVDADHVPIGYRDAAGRGLNPEETRTAIGLWALLGAPMWLAAEVGSLPWWVVALLTDVDLGRVMASSSRHLPARPVLDLGDGCELWCRGDADSWHFAGLVNRAAGPRRLRRAHQRAVSEVLGGRAVRELCGTNTEALHLVPPHGLHLLEVQR